MFTVLQETERYDNPHKAYTYNIRSIESTVGPVKVEKRLFVLCEFLH